jgi:hypothetical protein
VAALEYRAGYGKGINRYLMIRELIRELEIKVATIAAPEIPPSKSQKGSYCGVK